MLDLGPLQLHLSAKTPENLIVAGRCISAASAWDITRAIPTCAVTGQAAGVAAALACTCTDGDLRSLDIGSLQRALTGQDVQL